MKSILVFALVVLSSFSSFASTDAFEEFKAQKLTEMATTQQAQLDAMKSGKSLAEQKMAAFKDRHKLASTKVEVKCSSSAECNQILINSYMALEPKQRIEKWEAYVKARHGQYPTWSDEVITRQVFGEESFQHLDVLARRDDTNPIAFGEQR